MSGFASTYLVGENLSGFLIDAELGSLLVRLLHDAVLHLTVDALVAINRVDLDDRAAVRRAFLDLGRVGRTIFKDGLVVVDVGDEDDDDGGRRVKRRRVDRRSGAFDAALSVVSGGHVQLVLVAVQHDRTGNKTNDAGVLLDPEQTGSWGPADEPERDAVAVLVRRDDGGHEGVGSGVFVDVGRVHLLRKLGRLVVLILGVDADCGCSGPGRITWKENVVTLNNFQKAILDVFALQLETN